MPDKKKKGIAKLIDDYKFNKQMKKKVKEVSKTQTGVDKYDRNGNIIFKKGGMNKSYKHGGSIDKQYD